MQTSLLLPKGFRMLILGTARRGTCQPCSSRVSWVLSLGHPILQPEIAVLQRSSQNLGEAKALAHTGRHMRPVVAPTLPQGAGGSRWALIALFHMTWGLTENFRCNTHGFPLPLL